MFIKTLVSTFLLLLVSCFLHPGQLTVQSAGEDGPVQDTFNLTLEDVYKALQEPELSFDAFRYAMTGYRSLCLKGMVIRDSILTILDYNLPSSKERFYVINLRQNKMIFKTLVAHGRNSGNLYASHFSNKAQSHQSALGFYITGAPYEGGQGYSMCLMGVDTGYNHNALKRSIVVHGARYATHQYVQQYGRLGRSFGCPALPPGINAEIIDYIKDGSVFFSYFPDDVYLNNSIILGSSARKKTNDKPVI